MVIEKFKPGAVREIYERALKMGRMLPNGLEYINSWPSENLTMCFQLMRCDELHLIEAWTQKWEDLVEFEVIPVISSAAASEKALRQ